MAAEIRHGMMEGNRLKVFAANARCLSMDEVSDLPREVRTSAGAAAFEGTWLEVKWSKEACISGKDTVRLSVKGVTEREEEGLWLGLFCPDKSCVITDPSNLPFESALA
jgi:hypothetical protein